MPSLVRKMNLRLWSDSLPSFKMVNSASLQRQLNIVFHSLYITTSVFTFNILPEVSGNLRGFSPVYTVNKLIKKDDDNLQSIQVVHQPLINQSESLYHTSDIFYN